ncbi:ABC transporter ATP-binding protein [Sulfurivermis fontis]|uniref:ABC transporter ATP-binding protein n=1 Tax=Sulfurivermis fontis TaxID=1972068 RepID=UPI000FD88AA0|nr:ABC transporter ATP-binding protein [Sulfurivermis fontis]
MSDAAIALADVRFRWRPQGPRVLDIPALAVARGERLFLRGPSGSGKSTLLGLLGGVMVPQQGEVAVLGRPLHAMGGAARDRFRADHIGYIFQMFNLVPYLSVVDNVLLPCRFSRLHAQRVAARGDAHAQARRLLAHLGLDGDLLSRAVTELSVGQQQRVAAARALLGAPELIIADEPTSALDADHRAAFVELLLDECAALGSTLVFVSHDRALEPLFHRALCLEEINRAGGRS